MEIGNNTRTDRLDREIVQTVLLDLVRTFRKANPSGKIGKRFQQHLKNDFPSLGLPYRLTMEDRLLPATTTMWRTQDEQPQIAPGTARFDHALYLGQRVVGLIEVESDLDDVNNRTRDGLKNYFVRSLAKNGDGHYFSSYRSLERMAIGARHLAGRDISVASLEGIASDSHDEHNPEHLPLFLVNCAGSQSSCIEVLQRRMDSLQVTLIHPFM